MKDLLAGRFFAEPALERMEYSNFYSLRPIYRPMSAIRPNPMQQRHRSRRRHTFRPSKHARPNPFAQACRPSYRQLAKYYPTPRPRPQYTRAQLSPRSALPLKRKPLPDPTGLELVSLVGLLLPLPGCASAISYSMGYPILAMGCISIGAAGLFHSRTRTTVLEQQLNEVSEILFSAGALCLAIGLPLTQALHRLSNAGNSMSALRVALASLLYLIIVFGVGIETIKKPRMPLVFPLSAIPSGTHQKLLPAMIQSEQRYRDALLIIDATLSQSERLRTFLGFDASTVINVQSLLAHLTVSEDADMKTNPHYDPDGSIRVRPDIGEEQLAIVLMHAVIHQATKRHITFATLERMSQNRAFFHNRLGALDGYVRSKFHPVRQFTHTHSADDPIPENIIDAAAQLSYLFTLNKRPAILSRVSLLPVYAPVSRRWSPLSRVARGTYAYAAIPLLNYMRRAQSNWTYHAWRHGGDSRTIDAMYRHGFAVMLMP
jgi:hypothetical protein